MVVFFVLVYSDYVHTKTQVSIANDQMIRETGLGVTFGLFASMEYRRRRGGELHNDWCTVGW